GCRLRWPGRPDGRGQELPAHQGLAPSLHLLYEGPETPALRSAVNGREPEVSIKIYVVEHEVVRVVYPTFLLPYTTLPTGAPAEGGGLQTVARSRTNRQCTGTCAPSRPSRVHPLLTRCCRRVVRLATRSRALTQARTEAMRCRPWLVTVVPKARP